MVNSKVFYNNFGSMKPHPINYAQVGNCANLVNHNVIYVSN